VALSELGARAWQSEIAAPILEAALLEREPLEPLEAQEAQEKGEPESDQENSE
jgi:ribonuclease D